jgi:hypothetical protein
LFFRFGFVIAAIRKAVPPAMKIGNARSLVCGVVFVVLEEPLLLVVVLDLVVVLAFVVVAALVVVAAFVVVVLLVEEAA